MTAEAWAARRLGVDAFAREDLTFPYARLAAAGVGPEWSMDELADLPFVLMAEGGMTQEQRTAWSELGSVESRLGWDALHYPDSSRFDTMTRDAAIEAWLAGLRARPGDTEVVHAVAVGTYWAARELDHGGRWEEASREWGRALAWWGAVVTDAAYWADWCVRRAAWYGRAIGLGAPERLCLALERLIPDALTDAAQRHADDGREHASRRYLELAHAAEVEVEGARTLRDAGGLRLTNAADRAVAGGREFLRLVELDGRLAEYVAHRHDAAASAEQSELNRALRCAFSDLGAAFVHSERGHSERALRAVPDLAALPTQGDEFQRRFPSYAHLTHPRMRLRQDAGYIVIRACLALARNALTGSEIDVSRAVGLWRDALGTAGEVGLALRTRDSIRRTVLGRAKVLGTVAGARRDAALDTAITLVRQTTPLLGATAADELRARLAVLLTDRAQWHGYACRAYQPPNLTRSAADARQALDINPHLVRARSALVHALVIAKPHGVGRVDWLRTLIEALRHAIEGIDLGADSAALHSALRTTLDELETALLGALSLPELAQLTQGSADALLASGDTDEERAHGYAQSAAARRRRGDASGAAAHLIHALRLVPGRVDLLRELHDTTAELIHGDEGADDVPPPE